MERRILVVDDSPTQAERVRLLLEREGYRVEVAQNGRAALQRVRLAPPDLIISDVVMPEMDGYAFCRAVKSSEATKQVPLVLLTVRRDPADIIAGLEAGADNFIGKPFEDDYLVERVRRIFEHLELRAQGRPAPEMRLRVGGREIAVGADNQQIIELLFSTFEELCRTNDRLAASERTVEEHARTLEAKVEERTQVVSSLAQVGRELVGTLDLATVTDRIVATVLRQFQARRSILFRLAPGSGALVCVAVAGEADPRQWIGRTLPRGTGISGLAVAEGRSVRSPDLSADPRLTLPEWLHERIREEGVESTAGVPLIARGETLGALIVADRQGREFTEEDLRLLSAFADQAALGLQNALLYEDAERRRRTAESLADVGRLLSQSLDPDEVGQGVVDGVTALLGVRMSVLYRLEPESGDLVVLTVAGEAVPELRPGAALPQGLGASGLAVRERQPIMTPDFLRDPRIALTPELRARLEEAPHRAVLAMPLVLGGAVIGVLAVGDRAGRVFDDEEVRLAQAFADQATLALENARLYREATRQRRDAEALARGARALTESVDLTAVAERIVESVQLLFSVQTPVLWRLQPDGSLVVVARAGAARDHFDVGDVAPPGMGVCGRTVAEGEPVWCRDALTDPRIRLTDDLRRGITRSGIGAILAVPLRARGAIIGALAVGDETGRVFSEGDVALLQAFADQGALALQNARLYDEVRGARDFLRSVAENSADAIVTTDGHGRITYFSDGGSELFGYRSEEVVGRRVADFTRSGGKEARAVMRRLRATGRVRGYETVLRAKDDRWIEVGVSLSLLRDASGAVAGTLGVFGDISERKRVEEQLQRQRDALYQSEKLAAMGSLLAGVAHELNNPLSVVIGQATLLRRTAGEGPLAARAEKIAQAGERCAHIVKTFLALARQHPPQREEVQLNHVVQEVLELLAYPLRVDSVELVLDLAGDLPTLWADPHQLHQVVVNLVTNAQQAMRQTEPPRRLTLATGADPARARVSLEVADTGPGIPPENQARVFEPFFTSKPPGEGTGLGLSLCQGIVEAHGGSITAESAPGRGATFRIELPVGAPPAAAAAAPPAEAASPISGKAILVVDDEPEVAAIVAEMLSSDGHHVETAANGAIALDKLRERPYDVILSDLRMPELDGPGLYRELERRHPQLLPRLIFLTGDTLGPEVRRFLEETGAPSLGKPFSLPDLRRAIECAAGSSHA